jgi:hypothetical protein
MLNPKLEQKDIILEIRKKSSWHRANIESAKIRKTLQLIPETFRIIQWLI